MEPSKQCYSLAQYVFWIGHYDITRWHRFPLLTTHDDMQHNHSHSLSEYTHYLRDILHDIIGILYTFPLLWMPGLGFYLVPLMPQQRLRFHDFRSQVWAVILSHRTRGIASDPQNLDQINKKGA
eukprot:769476_1